MANDARWTTIHGKNRTHSKPLCCQCFAAIVWVLWEIVHGHGQVRSCYVTTTCHQNAIEHNFSGIRIMAESQFLAHPFPIMATIDMETIIEALSSGPEDARRWLTANRANDGYADISQSAWDSSLAVIHGVGLDKVRLAGRTISPNFVNCVWRDSEFLDLTTDGHFWGAGNEWHNCSFTTSVLCLVISPQNLFAGCTFNDVVFEGYVACETLFESCRFMNCKFESLRTIPKRRSRWAVGRMASLGSSLQFVGCEFHHPEFRYCVFADSVFSKSRFVDPMATECDFTYINSDHKWWPDSTQCDVFVSHLDHVITEIIAQLGNDSPAAKSLLRYRNEYVCGHTFSKDYSACLYDGTVPDPDLDVVEGIIDQVGPRFGL